jgi:ATP-dependent RNA helicase DeaD
MDLEKNNFNGVISLNEPRVDTPALEKPTSGFAKFGFSRNLNRALEASNFLTPTPVQEAAIPVGLEGRDVLACAQTGTGKTAAFLLPIISHLEKNLHDTALVVGPTREIIQQSTEAARVLLQFLPSIGVCSIIGGGRMDRQLKALQKRPRLIIGTPGRLNDFIARRKVNLSACRVIVFDEADRMLDMGFAPQIDQIIKFAPKERQTMMFSATIAPPVEKIARSYLKDAKFISVGPTETAPELLRQKVIITTLDKKEDVLRDELNKRKGSVLIFAQTQRRVEKLGYVLREYGYNAETIHGGRTQGQRFRALQSFRDGDVNILVATDVASRGLDIGTICHVINYDLSGNPEDFLHRVGRAARNGKEGDALTLLTQADFSEYRRIKKYMGDDCEIVGEFAHGSGHSGGGSKSGGRPRRFGGGGGGGARRKKFGTRAFGDRKPGGKPSGERNFSAPSGGGSRYAGKNKKHKQSQSQGPRPSRSFERSQPR